MEPHTLSSGARPACSGLGVERRRSLRTWAHQQSGAQRPEGRVSGCGRNESDPDGVDRGGCRWKSQPRSAKRGWGQQDLGRRSQFGGTTGSCHQRGGFLRGLSAGSRWTTGAACGDCRGIQAQLGPWSRWAGVHVGGQQPGPIGFGHHGGPASQSRSGSRAHQREGDRGRSRPFSGSHQGWPSVRLGPGQQRATWLLYPKGNQCSPVDHRNSPGGADRRGRQTHFNPDRGRGGVRLRCQHSGTGWSAGRHLLSAGPDQALLPGWGGGDRQAGGRTGPGPCHRHRWQGLCLGI